MSHPARSSVLVGGALLALLAWSGTTTRPAAADVVLADGKWEPLPDGIKLPANEDPGDDLLAASAGFKIDAAYDVVKSNRGFSKPAGLVVKILASDRTTEAYRQALNDASSAFFQEAAEGFLAASEGSQGYGKQEALWLRVQAFAEAGAADKVVAAIADLLAAFPKTYYFADAYILKAKVETAKGNAAGAQTALAMIKSAPGMNPRDLLRAEYWRIYLTMELQRNPEGAAADYRKLVADAEKVDAAMSAVTRQQALVGLGNCLLATKKEAEARGFFDKATEARDADVLAGAYAGLGDIGLTEAKALREGGKLKEAKEKLEDALLQYLRVTVMYRLDVKDIAPVLRAMDNQAKVFVALFEMSGNKDCELANRAYSTFAELSRMLPDGQQKRAVVRTALEFDQKREAAGCKQK